MSSRVYDEWAGNPKGVPEDKTRCVKEVSDSTSWYLVQCSLIRGYGPDVEYCKQHCKIEEKRRLDNERRIKL